MAPKEIIISTEDDSSQQLERLLALGMVASGVTHEIANPLNAIMMNAELGLLYLQQNRDSENVEALLQTIINESKRAGQLAQSVTEFSRMSRYTPSDTVDMSEIISQSSNLLSSKLRRNAVELKVQTQDKTLPRISANPTALKMALVSLVDIAIENGIKKVLISISQSPSELVLTVENKPPLPLSTSSYGQLMLLLADRIFAEHQATRITENDDRFSIRFPLPTNGN